MNDSGALPLYILDVQELTPLAFAPFGQVIMPLPTGGQGAETHYDPETSVSEAKLVLTNGAPRLWIMHLQHVGLGFSRIARHRHVTQCLGSLGGKEWLIGVAPPGDLGDDARPRLEDMSPSGYPGTASSSCMSRPGMRGRISCTTSASSLISKTSTPTGAIFTPCPFPPSAATGSEPTRGEPLAHPSDL